MFIFFLQVDSNGGRGEASGREGVSGIRLDGAAPSRMDSTMRARAIAYRAMNQGI